MMITLHWRKYVAEFFGTAVLAFAVISSIQQQTATPFIAALTLMFFVYTIGGISGSHINPAVTAGLWSIKKIKGAEAIAYIVAQVLGAVVAQFVFQAYTSSFPSVDVVNGWGPTVAEAAGAFVFLFGVSAVVHERTHHASGGLIIGISLLLGILLASAVSNGIVNPAVAVGLKIFSPVYLFGPIVGGVLAAQFYQWIARSGSEPSTA